VESNFIGSSISLPYRIGTRGLQPFSRFSVTAVHLQGFGSAPPCEQSFTTSDFRVLFFSFGSVFLLSDLPFKGMLTGSRVVVFEGEGSPFFSWVKSIVSLFFESPVGIGAGSLTFFRSVRLMEMSSLLIPLP